MSCLRTETLSTTIGREDIWVRIISLDQQGRWQILCSEEGLSPRLRW